MSEIQTGMERARARHYGGMAQQIRDAITQAGEPISAHKISFLTGLNIQKVKNALSAMITRTGSVVSLRGRYGIVYDLYRAPAPPAPKTERERGQPAGRVEIGRGFRWWSGY